MITAIFVPEKQALIDTPEYENFGANGLEKSILPVYSIAASLAGIVFAEPAKQIVVQNNAIAKRKFLIVLVLKCSIKRLPYFKEQRWN
jgi:hypothetical protein